MGMLRSLLRQYRIHITSKLVVKVINTCCRMSNVKVSSSMELRRTATRHLGWSYNTKYNPRQRCDSSYLRHWHQHLEIYRNPRHHFRVGSRCPIFDIDHLNVCSSCCRHTCSYYRTLLLRVHKSGQQKTYRVCVSPWLHRMMCRSTDKLARHRTRTVHPG